MKCEICEKRKAVLVCTGCGTRICRRCYEDCMGECGCIDTFVEINPKVEFYRHKFDKDGLPIEE